MKKKFYDTNALLNLGEKLLESEDKFYVSQISLQELENIKNNRNKDEGVRAKARHVARVLAEHGEAYEFVPYAAAANGLLVSLGMPETPDNMICACAGTVRDSLIMMDDTVVFVTADLCCRLLAKNVFELDVEECIDEEENIYKGYKKIAGTTEDINTAMELIYSTNFDGWNVNEYLLIQNSDDGSEKEMRFDGTQFVQLKLPPSKFVKAKNSLQRCALDILNNQDITIAAILGGYGSGKTALTMKMALYAVQEKGYQSQIVGIRSPIGEGVQVGWLPGDFEMKTNNFWKPLEQQLEGKEFELERLLQQGVLSTEIPFYLKGQTLDGIILVDEAEDLTRKELRLVGTRIGQNSRIFLNGDYKQSVVSASADGNALIQMCDAFKGNPAFGCIYLDEDVRSSTSKMFAKLFE